MLSIDQIRNYDKLICKLVFGPVNKWGSSPLQVFRNPLGSLCFGIFVRSPKEMRPFWFGPWTVQFFWKTCLMTIGWTLDESQLLKTATNKLSSKIFSLLEGENNKNLTAGIISTLSSLDHQCRPGLVLNVQFVRCLEPILHISNSQKELTWKTFDAIKQLWNQITFPVAFNPSE